MIELFLELMRNIRAMFNWLKSLFTKSNLSYQQKQIERYLSNSTDLVDLERRQRELTHGKFKF